MANRAYHPANRGIVVVLYRVIHLANAQRFNRRLLIFQAAYRASYLRYP